MWSDREESVSKNSKTVNKRKNGMIFLEDFSKNSRIVVRTAMEGGFICKGKTSLVLERFRFWGYKDTSKAKVY